MPIYEYQCSECENRHEVIQGLSEPDPTDCPKCGKPTLRRLISAAGFRLKGGGWYETDFKKSGKKNLAGDSSKSETKSSESAGSKSTGTDS